MNKAKFVKKSILFATIAILAFSLIPVASAGVPPFMQDRPGYNNIAYPAFGFPNVFSTSEDLFFLNGWASSFEEIENDWAPKNPWKFKLFINDEEINLQRFEVPIPKELKTVLIKQSMWYHIFGPGYFTVGGNYHIRWEFWVKRPYYGDGKNFWRIYVDYSGFVFLAGPDFEASYEYDLIIVA